MAICMSLMERDYPKLAVEDRSVITKQIRAGYLFLSAVLFEPPMEFWDLPADFIDTQFEAEHVARTAGFHIPEYEAKKELAHRHPQSQRRARPLRHPVPGDPRGGDLG